jgi:N-acetylmuramoyl-L-alanine amidase
VTRRRPWLVPVLVAVAVLLVAGGVAFAVSKVRTQPPKPVTKDAVPAVLPSVPSTDEATPTVDASSADTTTAIEVPSVIGRPVTTAMTVMTAAGLTVVTRVADKPAGTAAADSVVAQDPPQGAKVPAGTSVTLTYQPKAVAAPAANVQAAPTGLIVAIDAGHQPHANNNPEWDSPAHTQQKPMVASGATGSTTHVPEYQDTWEVSVRLRDELVKRGVTVIMLRDSNDPSFNRANGDRARMANNAGARLVVHVHFDGVNGSPGTNGASALYRSGDSASQRAAAVLLQQMCGVTGAKNNGGHPHTDMTGLNWAAQPSVIVECGFLSNPTEDREAHDPAYQARIAAGLANGVMQYLGR